MSKRILNCALGGSSRRLVASALLGWLLVACGPLRFPEAPDGSLDAGTATDAEAPASPDATSEPDAGPIGDAAGVDASGDAGTSEDAGAPDSSEDAGSPRDAELNLDGEVRDGGVPDASPADSGTVIVSLVLGQQVVPGSRVLVHDFSGQLLGDHPVDAFGEVSIPAFSDRLISGAVPVGSSSIHLQTIAMHQPGPRISLDLNLPPASVGQVVVSFAGPHPGASSYGLTFGCPLDQVSTTDTSAPQTISLVPRCLNRRGEAQGVAWAIGPDDTILAFAQTPPIVPTATSAQHVTLSSWTAPVPLCSLDVSNEPAAATSLRLSCDPVIDSVVYTIPGAHRDMPSARPFILVGPESLGNSILRKVEVVFRGARRDSGSSLRNVAPRPLSGPLTDLIDLSLALPEISNPSLEWFNGPQVFWGLGPGTNDADALLISASWLIGGERSSWTLLLPPGTASPINLPELPAGLIAAPTQQQLTETASVQLIEVAGTNGYDAFAERYGLRWQYVPGVLSTPPLVTARNSAHGHHTSFQ
ncbi:hypothetical protein L6R52_14475 [Myxococcota bacterium]|nr:hypothetical protein [Myxococcota bacterium]